MVARAPERGARRRPFAPIAVAACVLWAAALAQVVSVSDPPTAFPTLPSVSDVTIVVTDIETAPPPARDAIVQLAALGVYPLTNEGEALPNEVIDLATTAFILVNAFAPEASGQFPAPQDVAIDVLAVLSGVEAVPGAPMTVGGFRDLLISVVRFRVADTAALEAELEARYPALEAGNPDAPLTRAGAALMATIALEFLGPSLD